MRSNRCSFIFALVVIALTAACAHKQEPAVEFTGAYVYDKLTWDENPNQAAMAEWRAEFLLARCEPVSFDDGMWTFREKEEPSCLGDRALCFGHAPLCEDGFQDDDQVPWFTRVIDGRCVAVTNNRVMQIACAERSSVMEALFPPHQIDKK